MSQPAASTSEVLVGLVERVTFHSEESGFCVLRVKARGHRELVTTLGHAAMISAGDVVCMSSQGEISDRGRGSSRVSSTSMAHKVCIQVVPRLGGVTTMSSNPCRWGSPSPATTRSSARAVCRSTTSPLNCKT